MAHTNFPILLLDDEPEVADLLDHVLKKEFPQANLVHFTTLSAALDYLDKLEDPCQIGVIIVDIDLKSGHTGLDLIQPLRQHQACRLTPLLVLTSQPRQSWAKAAYGKGVNTYANKPYSLAEWRQYVRDLRSYWHETVTIPNKLTSRKR